MSPCEALKYLELSRGIISSLDVDCRSEIFQLQETLPDVAARFSELRQRADTKLSTALTVSNGRGLTHSLP